MSIGFTGTQKGMTQEQKTSVKQFLFNTGDKIIRQGCCIGADKDFTDIAKQFGSKFTIAGYPSTIKEKTDITNCDIIYPVKLPLDRNKDIVNCCDILIAYPKGYKEELRSGTWSTIRYARKLYKHIIIIYPDGTVKEEKN